MHKKYIGKNRVENLKWLTDVWLKAGPPVCFLQGFSGVGKTDLARDFRDLAEKQGHWHHAVINEVSDRVTPSVLESLMELSVVLSQQGMPEMEQILFEESRPNLAHALERALKRPVVIILDEAQRFFLAESGAPLPEMDGILSFLRNRTALPGRLLLLSDRIVEEARWSEWIPKRTLSKLEPDEALEALEVKLREAGSDVDIDLDRKKEVVQYLDFNPRAIGSLVGALRYDTLDEIIGSNPGLWAVRDREVSREFLRALERDLLERTMRHLDEAHQKKLWRLAVHRRSFKREALEGICASNDEARDLRHILVTRFLLNLHKGSGALSLNPIVRDICFTHLRDDLAKYRQAHSDAADYHLRPFKAKQIVGAHSRLGASFAELRYHLVQAKREDELHSIGHRFTDHMKREIKSTSNVPKDREDLDERIGVLTVLIADGGAKGLEYHLACCLQERGESGDLHQAALHASRALGPGAPVAVWRMLADLKRQTEGDDVAGEVIRRGLRSLSDLSSAAPLYQLGAEIFAKGGKIEKAVALLKEGIKVIPPRKNLFAIYQALSEYLCRDGKPREAVAFLREGMRKVPEVFGRIKLSDGALLLCVGVGDSLQLAKIIEDSDLAEPLSRRQITFGRILQLQVSGRWAAAADLAKNARREFPWDMALAGQESFSLLAMGNAESALNALTSFPNFSSERSGPSAWLAALIHLRRDAFHQAERALVAYLGRPVSRLEELNERFLLRLWDEQEKGPENHRLCFHLPLMPVSVTGLTRSVHRTSFAPSVLPADFMPKEIGSIAPATLQSKAPEIYVSYAWGEDSTEEGLKREEVVNRLCEAVRRSEREIGRDKDRMRRGDSIERFAKEMSRAKNIVAVLSEKSLHSDFCMVHELFRAYRRCDYQRIEFQEKVIALVMDDAKPFLKDEEALLDLAVYWQNKCAKISESLKSIDPQHRNHDTWIFVNLMGEMVQHLPGMLGALTDTLMARGFEDIVRDDFQELIQRLSPVQRTPSKISNV